MILRQRCKQFGGHCATPTAVTPMSTDGFERGMGRINQQRN